MICQNLTVVNQPLCTSTVIRLPFQRVTCTLLEVLMRGPWYLEHCVGSLNLSG